VPHLNFNENFCDGNPDRAEKGHIFSKYVVLSYWSSSTKLTKSVTNVSGVSAFSFQETPSSGSRHTVEQVGFS